MRRQAAALIFGFALHHSLAGFYDTTREISVQGVITEFRFVNPHPFLIIDVEHQPWKLEMDNLSELVDVGMTKETFKSGDRVVVSGNRAREKSQQVLYIRKLDRPADGFRYEQVGTSPRINVKPR
jgi:Family of unknown function (DUF6152)